jgi:hypothetical protein
VFKAVLVKESSSVSGYLSGGGPDDVVVELDDEDVVVVELELELDDDDSEVVVDSFYLIA